jgi:DnaJ-class molecular chaperone
MRGRGISHLNGAGKGDQLVKVVIWIPEKISRATRSVFEDLARNPELKPH